MLAVALAVLATPQGPYLPQDPLPVPSALDKRVPTRLLGAADDWQAFGWIAQGYSWNPAHPADGSNGTVTLLDQANDYQLNEVWMSLGKDANATDKGFDFGARADVVYGTDYRFLTSAGLESRWNTGERYGVAMPQAYVEAATERWTVRAGHFVSPVGYAIVGTGNNFFTALPYVFQYGEPFTHTGLTATAHLDDDLHVMAGVVGGWDSTADWDSANSGFGANAWNRHAGAIAMVTKNDLATAHDTFAWFAVVSQEPDQALTGRTPRYLQSLVYTVLLDDAVQYVAHTDIGWQRDAVVRQGGAKDDYWYGLNQYLYWSVDRHWKWGLNLEWFRDAEGFRVGSPEPSFGSPNARSFGRGPFAGNFYRAMFGPQWQPCSNLAIKPAVLFDLHRGGTDGSGLQPFDGGQSHHQLLFTLECILFY